MINLTVHTARSALLAIGLGLLTGLVQAEEALVLQAHPFLTAKQIVEKFMPLASYLEKKLGVPVQVAVAKDYGAHIAAIGQDKVDIAYVGPAPYVELVAEYGAKPLLARLEVAGKPTFRGVIVISNHRAASDGGVSIRLQDLAGKRFGFGAEHSTMSHLVPRFMLHEAGITVDKLAAHSFLDSHDNVALGVLTGEFDAGALMEDVFRKYEAKGLQALAWTPDISEHVFVTRANLPAERITALREAMLGLRGDKDSAAVFKAIKSNMTGLAAVADSDYDNLRTILTHLKQEGVAPSLK